MEVVISPNSALASKRAAKVVANVIRNKADCVLGLATGSTPLELYKELINMHKNEGLDFSKVRSFNLDEYIGLPPDNDQSYHFFMYDNFFRHINIKLENTRVPNGMAKDVIKHCADYERQIREAGGIDIQVLGIGSDGHIAFNEPGSSLVSRTRAKSLTQETLDDNARFFGGDVKKVPTNAITMGIGTIMEAREIVLLAFGLGKANAVEKMVEGPVAAIVPASILQMHGNAKVFFDDDSSTQLKYKDYYNLCLKNKIAALQTF